MTSRTNTGLPAPAHAAIKEKLFGDARYSSAYVVTSWWVPAGGKGPQMWATRTARTLAGANRIAVSAVIRKGLRRPCTVTITRLSLEEVTDHA